MNDLQNDEIKKFFTSDFYSHIDRCLSNVRNYVDKLFKVVFNITILMLTGWVVIFTTCKGVSIFFIALASALHVIFLIYLVYVIWDGIFLSRDELEMNIEMRSKYFQNTLTRQEIIEHGEKFDKKRKDSLKLLKIGLWIFFITFIASFVLMVITAAKV